MMEYYMWKETIIQYSPATIVPPGNRLYTIRILAVAPSEETKFQYALEAFNHQVRSTDNFRSKKVLQVPQFNRKTLCMTRSLTKELFTPFKDLEQEFRSSRKLFKTLSLDESRSPKFDLFSDLEENYEEEVTETMAETIEEYMSKTPANYGSSISKPKIDDKYHFLN
ncbi:hypothetical protein Tco_0660976 [Tanacetum coccineum]